MSASNESFDLIADLGESAIDLIIENEVLREIPILSTAVGIARISKSIRERAFLRKIATFLEHLPEQTPESRAHLALEVEEDTRRRMKFGEALFTTLEQADSTVKAEYAAVVFASFLRSEISDRELRELCHAIRVAQVDELVRFAEEQPNDRYLQRMTHTGLVAILYPKITFDGDTKPQFKPTKIGSILRNLLSRNAEEETRKANKSQHPTA